MAGCHCGVSWGGFKTCHCSECHETFTSLSAFDMHRKGSYERDGRPNTRHCVAPGEAGRRGGVCLVRDDLGRWVRFQPGRKPHPHSTHEPTSASQPIPVLPHTP